MAAQSLVRMLKLSPTAVLDSWDPIGRGAHVICELEPHKIFHARKGNRSLSDGEPKLRSLETDNPCASKASSAPHVIFPTHSLQNEVGL